MINTSSILQAQKSLDSIVASLQHIPDDSVRNARIATRAALGKSGMIGGAAIGMQAATMVGTASTGTALSTLSGAALYSSQMAWLGFGSMAVGGVVLFGIGAASGKALNSLYTYFYAGKPRKLEKLTDSELSLFLAAKRLAENIDPIIVNKIQLSASDAVILALEGLVPIAENLRLITDPQARSNIKLAAKPTFHLRRQYFRLMATAETLAKNLHPSRLGSVIARNGHVTGVDADLFNEALADVGMSDAATLRDRYLEILEEGTGGNSIERFEESTSKTIDSSMRLAGKALQAASEITGTHGPIITSAVTDRVSNGWIGMNLPEITTRETLGRHADAGAKLVQQGAGKTKKGAASLWKHSVKSKDRLLGAASGFRDQLSSVPTTPTKPEERRSMSAKVVLAVTFQKLLSDEYTNLTLEEDMVLQALRIAIPGLEHANASKIADYLQGKSHDQLRGIISTTKGKYHEMLYVEAQLEAGADIAMHNNLNHAGSDVVYIMKDGSIQDIQLKAVASRQDIDEHLLRYPGLEIRTTEEMAAITGFESTGFSNADLSAEVQSRLQELKGESFLNDAIDAGVTGIVMRGAISSRHLLRGEYKHADVVKAIRDVGISAGAGVLLEQLLLS